jgi:excinuclease ABC subunit C
MNRRVKSQAEAFPDAPGIYFFRNSAGRVIYIGKARSLRHRISSYFQAPTDPKVTNILAETADISYILTGSEKEASFLENNFVRQHQPKFNLRLKDDKSFPYLKVTAGERFPALRLTRRVDEDGGRYFGPFSPASRARQTIRLVARHFGIRTCQEKIPGQRKRPCLEYDLNLCSAPCIAKVSESGYREDVEKALLFLEGKSDRLLSILQKSMKEAADGQRYEEAARWRDTILAVEEVKDKPRSTTPTRDDLDIIGYARIKKWTFRHRDWAMIYSQLMIYFGDRIGERA